MDSGDVQVFPGGHSVDKGALQSVIVAAWASLVCSVGPIIVSYNVVASGVTVSCNVVRCLSLIHI